MKKQTQELAAAQSLEDRAVEEMIAVEGIYPLEELAMSHLWDFAERLEKLFGRRLKKRGLEQVDYFEIAVHFTRSLFARLDGKRGK